jgi:hypothetical protein
MRLGVLPKLVAMPEQHRAHLYTYQVALPEAK